jgi:Na+/phosphate symporter
MASTALDMMAKKLALLNAGINILRVLLFATLLQPVISMILAMYIAATQQVALVHTVFNLAAAIVALLILPYLWPNLKNWLEKSS